MSQVEINVNGIPAIAEVTHYHQSAPNHNSWDSDWDYYGYTEVEFELKDRKGYPRNGSAQWLERIVEQNKLRKDLEQQVLSKIEWGISNDIDPDF